MEIDPDNAGVRDDRGLVNVEVTRDTSDIFGKGSSGFYRTEIREGNGVKLNSMQHSFIP